MTEIVKYRNELNSIPLSKFVSSDLDMIMLLCAKMKKHKTDELVFSFAELKKGLDLSDRADYDFLTILDSMQRKLGNITCNIRSEKKRITFNLFPTLETDLESKTLTVSVNPKFAFLLNELANNFTAFELKEFVRLESKYSKSLYRLLKQWRTKGKYEINVDTLRELMDCPAAYETKIFMRDCLNPAVKELSAYFQDLTVEPIRGDGRGRPVKQYRFAFKPEKQDGSTTKRINRTKPNEKNRFNNFTQRDYDFDEYEKNLLTTNE